MRRTAIVAAFALALAGCHLLPSATAALRGLAMVSSAIDAAEAGASVYLQRHPSLEAERGLAKAILRARLAVSALSAALAAPKAENEAQARLEAVRAYGDLVALLDSLGVLDGRAALGGAETDAPMPGRVPLPSVADVSAALR